MFCSRSSALTSPWTGTRDCKVIHYYTVPLRTLCCRYGVVCLQWCCVHYGGLEWDSGDCEEQEERGSFESWTIWDWLQFCVPCHRWELFRNANYNFCYQMLLFSCQNNFLFNTAVSSNYTGKKYLCSCGSGKTLIVFHNILVSTSWSLRMGLAFCMLNGWRKSCSHLLYL